MEVYLAGLEDLISELYEREYKQYGIVRSKNAKGKYY